MDLGAGAMSKDDRKEAAGSEAAVKKGGDARKTRGIRFGAAFTQAMAAKAYP